MLSCRHTNIHSKHPSWESAGGEFKHFYHGSFTACLWAKALCQSVSVLMLRMSSTLAKTMLSEECRSLFRVYRWYSSEIAHVGVSFSKHQCY